MEDLRLRLIDLMTLWQDQEINEKDVHIVAEKIWDDNDFPYYPESDVHSIAVEVLSYLDVLNHLLITPEDISVIINFLETPPDNVLHGWQAWKEYWNQIDIEKRKNDLSSNAYYHTSSIIVPKTNV